MGSTECGAEGLNKVEGLLFQCPLRSNVIMDLKMKRWGSDFASERWLPQ